MSAAALPVAVVVATYRRPQLLPRLITALETQTVPPAEVVVVDDSSGDATGAVLRALAASTTLPLTVLCQPVNGGPAAARNRGWRATSAPVIAFTDDDCVPEPQWIEGLVAEAASDVVQGRTVPDEAQAGGYGPFSRTLDVPELNWFFQTCNIAYRREWLDSTGGFDEAFRYPMGEDTDLAWRAIEGGATVSFAADAVVRHDIRPSSWWIQLTDSARWEAIALVVAKHPEIRQRLHRPWVWRASHPPALLAALGIGIGLGLATLPLRRTPQRLVALGLLVPYAKHRLFDAPLPYSPRLRQRARLLPAALVLDLAEIAVLLAASARYRTFVL